MKDQPPESKPTQTTNTEGTLASGYTVARIRNLTPEKPLDVRSMAKIYDRFSELKVTIDESVLQPEQSMRIQIETAALSSLFIKQVWEKIYGWVVEHPPGIAQPSPIGAISAMSRGEIANLKQTTKDVELSGDVADILRKHTDGIFAKLVSEWYDEQETMVSKTPEPTDGKERKLYKAYKRYKKVLSFGMTNIQDRVGGVVTSANKHILGGFTTARFVTWECLKVLPEVYQQQYGRTISKDELKKLVTVGASPLVLAMAATNVPALDMIQHKLTQEVGNVALLQPLKVGFKPDKFSISKRGNNLYLEIKPEILDEIESEVEKTSRQRVSLHTGCPALTAEGTEGKNVVSEMYDWLAKLYEEFYIDTHTEYR